MGLFHAGLVIHNSRRFANGPISQRSRRAWQWTSAARDLSDTPPPTACLPLPAPPDPSPNSQIRTNSQSSVIRAFSPPFANPMFAHLPTQQAADVVGYRFHGGLDASVFLVNAILEPRLSRRSTFSGQRGTFDWCDGTGPMRWRQHDPISYRTRVP